MSDQPQQDKTARKPWTEEQKAANRIKRALKAGDDELLAAAIQHQAMKKMKRTGEPHQLLSEVASAEAKPKKVKKEKPAQVVGDTVAVIEPPVVPTSKMVQHRTKGLKQNALDRIPTTGSIPMTDEQNDEQTRQYLKVLTPIFEALKQGGRISVVTTMREGSDWVKA
jgi:hypothetical protein